MKIFMKEITGSLNFLWKIRDERLLLWAINRRICIKDTIVTEKFSAVIADSKSTYSHAVIRTFNTFAIKYEQTMKTVRRVAERIFI